jgi:hypothetical protein
MLKRLSTLLYIQDNKDQTICLVKSAKKEAIMKPALIVCVVLVIAAIVGASRKKRNAQKPALHNEAE